MIFAYCAISFVIGLIVGFGYCNYQWNKEPNYSDEFKKTMIQIDKALNKGKR